MVSAIVLAAGTSSRMEGPNKLLLPFRDSTIIRHTVENVLPSGVGEVLVVTGYQREELMAALDGMAIHACYNPGYKSGMTGSIQTGVREAKGDAYMICLGDMPLVNPGDYQALVSEATRLLSQGEPFIVLPDYQNRRANPVIFSKHFREAILLHQQPDGCKEIVQQHAAAIHRVAMETDSVIRDIDYTSDYDKLISED